MDDRPVDIADCAREPIHVPGAIQPHGALLVLADDGRLLQASDNVASVLGSEVSDARRVSSLHVAIPGVAEMLEELRTQSEPQPVLRTLTMAGRPMHVLASRTPQGITCEFEPGSPQHTAVLDQAYARLGHYLNEISKLRTAVDLGRITARWVRMLTGFNRVLIYRFDEDWNGTVIAEDRDDVLPSYLDLRFPESDIPAQARELYLRNRTRVIPNAQYTPARVQPELSPIDGRPLDMSVIALRSVSPVHLEYMRNMDTGASMSVSIVVDGRLWGLVSCHNREPRVVPTPTRTMCDLLTQVMAQQVGAIERMLSASQRIDLKEVEAGLLARVSFAPTFGEGLRHNSDDWMRVCNADGAALVAAGTVTAVGQTPSVGDIMNLVDWLRRRDVSDVFSSSRLTEEWPEAARFATLASGVIAISISQIHPSYVLWFRREVVTTVKWGGDRRKTAAPGETRLHPRKSFETWKELVQGRSLPWSDAEQSAAADFRNAIVNVVLKRAEERAELTEELERSNSELEAFSYSVSHDLRAPFRHVVGYSKLLAEREAGLDQTSRHYLQSIVEAALAAGRLVDDLLHFSQLGRTSLRLTEVDLSKLVDEVRRTIEPHLGNRRVEWRVAPLPTGYGDANLLRQVLMNLIDNALKYARHRDVSIVTVDGEDDETETRISVADNGVGFDMAYVGKLFGVFQRLHRAEEFEGTGIGLALCKRVIERHGGWIKAEGKLGEGARMTFALPKRGRKSRPR